MAKKILRTNLAPTQVWSKVKEVVRTHDGLSSVRDKIRWNEALREATLSHIGVNARISVKDDSGTTVEIEVDAAFPASVFVNEEEIVSSVERELRKYV